jgi:lysophospholipase L1-like esterase
MHRQKEPHWLMPIAAIRSGGHMMWPELVLGILAGAAMMALCSQRATAQVTAVPASAPPPTVAAPVSPNVGMVEDPCAAAQPDGSWAELCHFHADNLHIAQGPAPKVVFMGDSITANWVNGDRALFTDGVIDRGISGQTSPQMLLRFYQDVIALHPQVVHIMAGTNDIAGNTGPTSPDQFKNNIMAMVTLARANHIAVVLGSIPPSVGFSWRPALNPAPRIGELNMWLRSYAAAAGATYADYHAVLAESDGSIQKRYSGDGVHPNILGYQAMRPIADTAIAHALNTAAK